VAHGRPTPEDRDDGFRAVVDAAPVAEQPEELLEFAAGIERSVVLAGCTEIEARRLATMVLVARLLREGVADSGPLRSSARMFARGSRTGGLSEAALRLAAGELALRDARIGAQPPREAIHTPLRLTMSVAPLHEVSLWLPAAGDRLEVAVELCGPASAGATGAARRAFAECSPTPASATRQLVAVPVGEPPEAIAALSGRAPRGSAALAVRVLQSAAPRIALALARQELSEKADASMAEAAEVSERALARFGYDVHDGPAQGIAGLLSDIRAFKAQVGAAFAGDPRADLLIGRLEDFEARSTAVADEIRRVAQAARSPAPEEPVEDALREELRVLREVAGGVKCKLEVRGPVDEATPSQRIALLRGVQEALRNVREHAGAQRVSVRVVAGADRTEAVVLDDGCGFDAERLLAASARYAALREARRRSGFRCRAGRHARTGRGQAGTAVRRLRVPFGEPSALLGEGSSTKPR
jgi:signal transduction histidine kinase